MVAIILCQENKLCQTCFLLWENSIHLFRHVWFFFLSHVKELHCKGWWSKACVNQKGRCIFLSGYLCIQKRFSLELIFQCRSPEDFLILRGNKAVKYIHCGLCWSAVTYLPSYPSTWIPLQFLILNLKALWDKDYLFAGFVQHLPQRNSCSGIQQCCCCNCRVCRD